MCKLGIPLGWNSDRTYHWLPGRLLVCVPGLKGNQGLAATLTARLRREPGVLSVQPNSMTGRVLLRLDARLARVEPLVALARQAWQQSAAEPRWVVSSMAALPGCTGPELMALAQQAAVGTGSVPPRRPVGARQTQLRWVQVVGRRVMRRLGLRGFRAARLMRRRGEWILCLLRNGRPQGLFGLRQAPGQAASDHLATAAVAEIAAAAEATATGPPGWHAMPPSQVLAALGVDDAGLATPEAEARRRTLGPNCLCERPQPGSFALFARQFREPMVLILLCAGVLSLALGEQLDAVVIIGIVAVNALLAVVQEVKARQALASLRQMTTATARVQRDGAVRLIPAADLVPGDVVWIEAGDGVPADLRLLDGGGLACEEAVLTGESGHAAKEPLALLEADTPLGDRRNMAYMGTFVRSGRGRGMVVATGMATELGRIAGLLQDTEAGPTPLQRRMAQVNRILVIGSLLAGAAMVVIGLARGMSGARILLAAISTAVAAIPEGLPITVTIALAMAVFRMGRRKAVVRQLPAVEALGAATTICSDKTGTLTCNQMGVREVWTAGRRFVLDGDSRSLTGRFLLDGYSVTVEPTSDLANVLRMATLCSNATITTQPDQTWAGDGDPTEVALLVAAARAGLRREELDRRYLRLHEIPFDAAERRMTVVCRDEQNQLFAHVKGAPDRVLGTCTHWHLHGRVEPLTDQDRALISTQAEVMAEGALRVLAVAYRPLPDPWNPDDPADLNTSLIFAGLVGLMDPPRREVRDALERCRRAGVRVIMVTGDHPRTARAIARDLGLSLAGTPTGAAAHAAAYAAAPHVAAPHVAAPHAAAPHAAAPHAAADIHVLTGSEIAEMTEAQLAAALEQTTVCARVAPEQKLRIVAALRSRHHVVAMTGDGVNDAPAVREADIGIAMGQTGTEVTRAAADIVLVDDNFATIVDAIEEGRGTYDNIRRTVRYTLATNIAEVVLMLGAVLVGAPLPLLPVHLLWINLVCDGVPALSLAFDRPAPGCMDRPPQQMADGLFAGGLWARMTARGVALGVGTLAVFGALLAVTGDLVLARSVAMAALITSKLLYVLEVRRDEPGRTGLARNPFLTWAVLGAAALFLGTLYLPGVQPFFRTAALGLPEWLGVAAVTAAGVALERLTVAAVSRRRPPELPPAATEALAA